MALRPTFSLNKIDPLLSRILPRIIFSSESNDVKIKKIIFDDFHLQISKINHMNFWLRTQHGKSVGIF